MASYSGAMAAQESVTTAPARPVCVLDSLAPNQLRLDSLVTARIPHRDSVVTRDGRRTELWQLEPRVVGYAAPAEGLPTDTVTSHSPGHEVQWTRILGVRYTRFGLDTSIPLHRMTRIGEVHGISVFTVLSLNVAAPPERLYVLVEPDCLWRPYMSELRRRTR